MITRSVYKNSLFFFPSHEGAGMVVPEALSYGIPSLCFDNNGPGLFVNEKCGLKIPYSNYHDSVQRFSQKLDILFHDNGLTNSLADGALKEFESSFLWDSKADRFEAIYKKITQNKNSLSISQKACKIS